jgi:alpha-amylase
VRSPTSQQIKFYLNFLKKHPEFTFSISFQEPLLEQLEKYAPATLETFKKLVETGRVEVLGETYYHSLAFYYSLSEFEEQVKLQNKILKRIFGVAPKVFSNTELAYRNDLATWAENAGYKGIIAEGWDPILGLEICKLCIPTTCYKQDKTIT